MEVQMKQTVKVDAKTLKIHMKVRDEFAATLVDAEGREIKDYEGYVPSLMPGKHYGDYVILDIDIETGQILNWSPPTAAQVEQFLNGGDDE